MPYDAGGLTPPSAASAATRRRTDANADPGGAPLDDVAAADEREAAEAPLPPPEQLTKWLGAIVKRDGLEALVKALLCAVPRDELMQTIEKLCNEQWGDEPLVTTDSGEARWESTSPSAPSTGSSARTMQLVTPRPTRQPGAAPSLLLFKRCWHCESDFGRSDPVCAALQVFDALEDQLIEKDEGVLQAEEEGEEQSARRAARYFMYRKWGWEKHGPLGKGNRVRIPKCVVEFIRNRYREEGCDCRLGGPLYDCTAHGYTGHRDAPAPEE